jgi:uncharacterized membrane protein
VIVRAVVSLLCLLGLYVSSFMLRKLARGEQGLLAEPSVVMSPRAKASGLPNALIGLLYYGVLLALTPFLHVPLVWTIALAASAVAAAFSVYLAYSLLFVTRMPCAYCWTGHVVNWALLAVFAVGRGANWAA